MPPFVYHSTFIDFFYGLYKVMSRKLRLIYLYILCVLHAKLPFKMVFHASNKPDGNLGCRSCLPLQHVSKYQELKEQQLIGIVLAIYQIPREYACQNLAPLLKNINFCWVIVRELNLPCKQEKRFAQNIINYTDFCY